MEYFKLSTEQEGDHYWHVDIPHLNPDGSWWDVWAFARCERYNGPTPIKAIIDKPGKPKDFNWGPFGPIVNERCASILAQFAANDIQLIPVEISGDNGGSWFIVNILLELDCLNIEKSIVKINPPDNATKPGEISGVRKYVIDGHLIQNRNLFRIKNWRVAIIGSSTLVNALMTANVSGIQYWKVDVS